MMQSKNMRMPPTEIGRLALLLLSSSCSSALIATKQRESTATLITMLISYQLGNNYKTGPIELDIESKK